MAARKVRLYLQNEGDRPREVGQLELDGGRIVDFELCNALLSAEAHTLAHIMREATQEKPELDKLLTDASC